MDQSFAVEWHAWKSKAVQTFKRDDSVNGAQFSRDDSRVLTWSDVETARLWDPSDPLMILNPAERIFEIEVRSGATLDDQLNLRTLRFDEWRGKVKSPEYRAIEKKLAAWPVKATPQPNAATTPPTK
ncbi:MAG: hypothetical protein WKF77_01945 [Planctomycetaceae bacterium]